MTGYRSEEVIGQNARILKSGEISPEGYRHLWQTILSGKQWEGELRSRKKSGVLYWEHMKISPVLDAAGKVTHFMAINEDITGRKSDEEERRVFQARLIQTDKMASLGVLASGVAHEINNPNNYIMFNSELLEKVWQSAVPLLNEYYTEHGDFILGGIRFSETREIIPRLFSGLVDGSERIGSIVKKMKDLTRQKTDGHCEQVDINSVVVDSVSILNHEIKTHCDNFELETVSTLPKALCDSRQITQVLINLVMNALQSLPDKKHGIRIRTFLNETGDRIAIAVEDEGNGMSPEVQARLAEPFFTTKAEKGGTGLGLYVSLAIIEENGGRLLFSSEPGKGTIATVLLPACASGAREEGEAAQR
jgi:hypothetical protein